MYLFLSHKLDPEGLAWPGEPVIKVEQMTDVSDDCPFCSYISTLPNHFGTHMDATTSSSKKPHHIVNNYLIL